jgi:hypothetical protein
MMGAAAVIRHWRLFFFFFAPAVLARKQRMCDVGRFGF